MTRPARWSVKVSPESDAALRTLLASRGSRRGDLSRFVEEAVNRAVLDETIQDAQRANAEADPAEIERQVTEALEEIRESFWSVPRR